MTLQAAIEALEELVAEFDAEPAGHNGPWYGRNDTGGIALARTVLQRARREASERLAGSSWCDEIF